MAGDSTDEPDPDAPDYYGFIGVPRDASQDEVDSALTRAKAVYHPDQSSLDNRTASRCFDRVRDAESVLTDPDRRSAYDTFIERFGPETGHDAYENWADSGGRVDPEAWDPETDGRTRTAGETTSKTSGDTTSTTTDTTESSATRRGRTTTTETDTSAGRTQTQQGTANRSQSRPGDRTQQGTTSRSQQRTGDSTRRRTAGTSRRERTAEAGSAGGGTETVRGGPWMGPVYSRLSTVRQRVAASRLAVFLPVAAWMGTGLDLAVAPGLGVRENVSIPAQFAVLAVLTLGAYVAVAFTDPLAAVLVSVLWLVAGVVLYVAGSALWLFAAGATYFVEGTGPPFYTALVVLVVVLGYALLVFGKAGRRPAEARTD